ncbi:peptidase [Shewanella sp. JM162201]|uniref:Peptidase n=1 Tax=Shewanella jiangmenensis TaxID=2837387 RepID=A0ABS5V6X2_9GAMM|nr:S41 family peptidase [Shewanella jiangmenensis]MBT1445474.1 peptidase [Shewanella jiangmenensis]
MPYFPKHAIALALAASLTACSGGGGSSTETNSGSTGSGGGSGTSDITWVKGQFASEGIYKDFCANPRVQSNDKKGTALYEKMWLRSWTNNTYLWYSEVPDNDPNSFATVSDYFKQLKTTQTTASGAQKDRFHGSMSSAEWEALSGSGESLGYGMEVQILKGDVPRKVVVAYTEPGSEAATKGMLRGSEIIEINGVDVVNATGQSAVDALNAGLFPSQKGAVSSFKVKAPDSSERSYSFTAATVVQQPVQNVKTLDTASGKVGYMLFNSHIATSEKALVDAVNQLKAAGVNDLVLDLRYNGGGLLAIASQLGYMIAGPSRTTNKVFEQTSFNDKHTSINPVTGQTLLPLPFLTTGVGFSYSEGAALPTLNLGRVFVLTTSGTCSASEAIINGLRGIDFDVVQIGNRTCGKPYGFYPTDNCGTTYFTIQFRGENNKGFGDYADGFEPSNSPVLAGESVKGCYLGDDFSHPLGDTNEAMLSAALSYRETGSCPALASASFDIPRVRARDIEQADSDTLADPRADEVFRNNRILTELDGLQR